MTGYSALMLATNQFSDIVDNLLEWVSDNEADLTDGGESADGLNDAFDARLRELCDGNGDVMESVRGEVATRLDSQGQFDVTRQWAGQWA